VSATQPAPIVTSTVAHVASMYDGMFQTHEPALQ
jgi:hypothetical protein